MLICYGITLFASACLLFLVQPMAGKMLLPLYGGTPAIWNACMVFFQAALLLGYGYAHLTIKYLGSRRQAKLHLLLMLTALLVLPITINNQTIPPADIHPSLYLLLQLTLRIGLPFFIIASSAPLLQRWLAETNHPSGQDPYFLYAASNTGSLLALLGYPLLFEPLFGVRDQSQIWSWGYGILMLLVAICVTLLLRNHDPLQNQPGQDSEIEAEATQTEPTSTRCLWWLLCAFVPSSLMLGTTSYITTNLAAIPLLWILPLALYLMTFILVFAKRQILPHHFMVRLLPFVVIPLAPFFFMSIKRWELALIPIHLLMFFVAAMVCHGELAKSRPASQYLTAFYLWMSLGGVLGGIFNALLAPLLFSRVFEYPLAMFLVCLILPVAVQKPNQKQQRLLDLLLPLLLALFMGVLFRIGQGLQITEQPLLLIAALAPAGLICLGCKERKLRFALTFGVLLLAMGYFNDASKGRQLYASRNFFGVKRVVTNPEQGIRYLYHGTTVHGSQALDPAQYHQPLAYYHRSGPMGNIFAVLDKQTASQTVAVIGLGVGSLASYASPGQHFDFYEIDPAVANIARNRDHFRFLSDMQGSYDIILGDGRLTIGQAPAGHYDMIILDAFSSDAIPVHLLTKEALKSYSSKLKEDGLLVFHISNRYLDLEPLMRGLAAELKQNCLIKKDLSIATEDLKIGKQPSVYAVMGQSQSTLDRLGEMDGWQRPSPNRPGLVWSDHFSNLIRLVKW